MEKPLGVNGLAGARVLLVEDEATICLLLEDLVETAAGMVVGPAASAERALALLDAEAVDVAVVDVGLKDGPGYPVAAALDARGIPFVFTTGHDQLPADWAGRPHLAKPVASQELLDMLVSLAPAGSRPDRA